MSILKNPLKIFIPIVTLDDNGIDNNVILKATVYSNNINVGTIYIDTSGEVEDELLVIRSH